VVVYTDRAEVTRRARIDVIAGSQEVVLTGLPLGLEPDSLRVAATGVPAKLGAVRVAEQAREPARSEELLAAEREVERLEKLLKVIGSDRSVDARLESFLESIKASSAQSASEDLGEGVADPNAIGAVYDLLASRFGELAAAELERAAEERRLREELRVARARLEAARPRGPIRFRIVAVEIETASAGGVELELQYVTRGASWRPAYRASLDAESGLVGWAAEGVVRQSTGEDWEAVHLSLSTAAPARAVEPPDLSPWFIRPFEPRRLEKGSAPRGAEAGFAEEVTIASSAPAMEDELARPAERVAASISETAYNVRFDVPGSANVPADGREHRVLLREDSLEASVRYRIVAPLAPAAYLLASTRSPVDYPLLTGPVRAFAGGAYLGSYTVEESGAGSEIDLSFGEDGRVRVERIRLPRESSREGFAGRDREVTFAWRTVVENLRDRQVEMVVEDRVPRSEDERVSVRMEKETSEGWREDEDRPGILLWELTLAARERRELMLVYSVRWPADLELPLPR
jgi:uncharacterized protein (TIGR02231 family)